MDPRVRSGQLEAFRREASVRTFLHNTEFREPAEHAPGDFAFIPERKLADGRFRVVWEWDLQGGSRT
jgi:hypothetical protein